MEGKVIHKTTVAVIGAGLAGLAAAYLLSRKGCRVILIEKKEIPGGRTFSMSDANTGQWMDNGQHVMMGCYVHTIHFLNTLHGGDVSRNERLLTKVTEIQYCDGSEIFSLPVSLTGLLAFKRWSLTERIAFLARFRGVISGRNNPGKTIRERLKRYNQPESHIRYFWEPLCLAIMNETIDAADPVMFFTALRTIFSSRKNSAIYIAAVSLNDLFVSPSLKIIRDQNGEIRCRSRAVKIISSCDHVKGIELSGGKMIAADYYISAVPVWDLEKILSSEQQAQLWNAPLAYQTSPIISAYIRYQNLPVCFTSLKPMTGCFGDLIQWLFVKPDYTVAITISAARSLADIQAGVLKEKILDDLRRLFGEAAVRGILSFHVIKERRATFSLRHDRIMFRPPVETVWNNFFLVGDWTDTGLPSTIESAVKSGYQAADQILEKPGMQ